MKVNFLNFAGYQNRNPEIFVQMENMLESSAEKEKPFLPAKKKL